MPDQIGQKEECGPRNAEDFQITNPEVPIILQESLRIDKLIQHRLGDVVEEKCLWRCLETAFATLEKLHAELFFKVLDDLADRGLRYPDLICGPRNQATVHDCAERLELPQVHCRLTFCCRSLLKKEP